jgi:hypothetical protein
MPYHMHKGHTWQTIDRYLSTHDLDKRAHRKAALLTALRDPRKYPRFTDVFDMIRPKSYVPPNGRPEKIDPVDALVAHMNKDWFGCVKANNGTGKWQPQPPFGPDNRTTGFWSNWYGDAEAIVREATARAIEVSFGLEHGADIPEKNGAVTDGSVLRNWPVEFWWLCGMRWFHASITWRHLHSRPRDGVVTVTWITPGNGDAMYHDLDSEPQHPDDSFALDPIGCETRFGSGIVGQPHNDTIAVKTWEGTPIGRWPSPIAVTHSVAERARVLSVVSPSFLDGGVSNQRPEWDY